MGDSHSDLLSASRLLVSGTCVKGAGIGLSAATTLLFQLASLAQSLWPLDFFLFVHHETFGGLEMIMQKQSYLHSPFFITVGTDTRWLTREQSNQVPCQGRRKLSNRFLSLFHYRNVCALINFCHLLGRRHDSNYPPPSALHLLRCTIYRSTLPLLVNQKMSGYAHILI